MGALTLQEKYRHIVAGQTMVIATFAKTVRDKYGIEGLNALKESLERAFRQAALSTAGRVGAKIGGDVTDVAKIADFMDEAGGMEREWIELSPGRGVIRIKSCPAARQYKRIFPEYCRLVLIGAEMGIASAINPKIQARSAGKYLSEGDECCEIAFEFEK